MQQEAENKRSGKVGVLARTGVTAGWFWSDWGNLSLVEPSSSYSRGNGEPPGGYSRKEEELWMSGQMDKQLG